MAVGQLNPLLQFLRRVSVPHGLAELPDAELLRRFTDRRDETAFTALLHRHGPMVFGVCRRVLGASPDTEDAFQATFLLLVRKAGCLRRPETLGPWLHGVAYRTACKARGAAARRRLREGPLDDVAALPSDAATWRDLRPVLDDAVDRLPAKYRVPFILCYLEGKTNAEAARQLGCPRATVATRLARAREQLRRRLSRRGLAPSVALGAALSAEQAPAALLGATARAGIAVASGGPLRAGVVSANVLTLTQGVLRSMFLDRLRVFVVAVMVLAAAGTGSGLVAYRASAAEVDEPPVSEVTPARPPAVPPVQPAAPPPPVVAEAAPEPGVYRTINFEVHAPTDEIARRIARAAERERRACARHWLGRELPAWPQRCPVRVTLTGAGSGGATSFAFDRGRVVSMNMHVEGPVDRLLSSVVPHEVAHTVFAHYFRCPVPRWADEGGALQSEDAAERQRHDRLCRGLLNNGDALTLRAMFGLTDYPEDVMTLYAEGYAVTRFLVEKKDPGTFLAFVAHGMHHDWDAAVRKYYGYEDVDDLQAAWLAAMRRKGGVAAKAAAPGARVKPDAADLRHELDDLRDQVRVAEKDLQRMEDSLKQKRQQLAGLRRRIERLSRELGGR